MCSKRRPRMPWTSVTRCSTTDATLKTTTIVATLTSVSLRAPFGERERDVLEAAWLGSRSGKGHRWHLGPHVAPVLLTFRRHLAGFSPPVRPRTPALECTHPCLAALDAKALFQPGSKDRHPKYVT